ncbi:Mss4-like protein [Mariannaea sp. PMI_226]|nr:Mss4-like protein [Mariannaea sp. PMI_226]
MATQYPDSVTGGCLCGSVRYQVKFPADHDWNNSCSTCQCSQCRKNSGSLLARLHGVPASAVTFLSESTLKTFHATPPCARGFCNECGSFLFWRNEEVPEKRIALAVGTFDQEDLKRWGTVLTTAGTHLWCEDEIPEVTDHLKGEKWKLDCDGEGAERMN